LTGNTSRLTVQPAAPRRASAVKRFFREWGSVVIAVLLIRCFLAEAFMVPTGSMLDTIFIGDCMLVNKWVYGVKLPFADRTILPVTNPKRGDIVIFRFPLDPVVPDGCSRIFPSWMPLLPVFWSRRTGFFRWYTPLTLVKRCVAVAGDMVEYREKKLYVNGELQIEPAVQHSDPRMLPALAPPPQDYQRVWERLGFFRTSYSAYVRDNFGPVVVPAGHIFGMGDNRDNSEDSRFFGPLALRHVKGKPLFVYFSSRAADNPPNFLRILLSPWAIRLGRIGRLVR
jgi:signal peptidase I